MAPRQSGVSSGPPSRSTAAHTWLSAECRPSEVRWYCATKHPVATAISIAVLLDNRTSVIIAITAKGATLSPIHARIVLKIFDSLFDLI